MKHTVQPPKAQQRLALILQVRSGQISATTAAQTLGISRQAYHRWERRALRAMLQALEDQPPGRPKGTMDPEKDHLKNRVEELERKVRLYEQRENLRTLLKEMAEPRADRDSATKKNSK